VTFEEYVNDRGQSLLRLAYVLTGDTHLAEDLTQTSLVKAYRSWSSIEAARSPDAYVRRILVNAHLSWRRRRSSTERPSETLPESGVSADPAEAIVAGDETRRLLATLAPKARTVLVLRYYADLDDAAIAELMGIGTSTVRATASRALAVLRSNSAFSTSQTSQARPAKEETR
jgi:RNA polymerase sigma-70 factor (sigma-E family)